MAELPAHDTAAQQAAERKSFWSKPFGRVAFWVCVFIVVLAALAALFAAGHDGWQGFVLLSGLAAIGFLVLYAIAAGETAGRSMRKRINQNQAPSPAMLAGQAMEAFPDPVLMTDQRGAARWANTAYRDLARATAGFGQSFGIPGIDRRRWRRWRGLSPGPGRSSRRGRLRIASAARAGRWCNWPIPPRSPAAGRPDDPVAADAGR